MKQDLLRLFLVTSLLLTAVPAWSADDLPDDDTLVAEGARIGTITVRVLPIFDRDEANALFRLADDLHIDTREHTIREQLLMHTGDPYAPGKLAETERNLRDLRFLREPQVRPVAYHDGIVDLEVVSRDVWTTNPGLSYGRAGGSSNTGFSFEELNLLGLGKQVALDYRSDVDRSSYTLRWRDPNILGSRWKSDLSLTSSDDGSGYGFAVARPFYSLDTRWSFGTSVTRSRGRDAIYSLGQNVGAYDRDRRTIDLHIGWSPGLRNGWVTRWSAGLRRDEALFSPVVNAAATGVAPDDRLLAYPYLRVETIQDDFATIRNLDQIARTEDLEFGTRYLLELGIAAPAFGADRSAGILRAEASRGIRLAQDHSLFVASTLANRFEDGAIRDGLATGSMRYYWHTSPGTKFVALLSGELGHQLDDDHMLMLGGDSGLRGYPLRYQNGNARALLTLEERIYTSYNLFGLADVGGAVFFDVGRTWGDSGIAPLARSGLLKDVGLGLRLGNTRSALGNVLHLDIAVPLDGDRSISRVQFLIRTEGSF